MVDSNGITDRWTVTNRNGVEVTRVNGADYAAACEAATIATGKPGGFGLRRLRASELTDSELRTEGSK